jgi:hypothetical protein
VEPPPPDRALEEAFAADPPWDQVVAGDEETEYITETIEYIYAVSETLEWSLSRWGGGGRFITYPDDHSPNVQSRCNKTGQGCSGHRGGGHFGGAFSCAEIGGLIGGGLGGLAGGALTGGNPGGALAGGTAGAVAGSRAGGAVC